GRWIQTRYRLLCQSGESNDLAIGLAGLPGFEEDEHLLAVGATYIDGNLDNRGIKVEGMERGSDRDAWADATEGDAERRTFFQRPDSLSAAAVRPCTYTFHALATSTGSVAYNYTYTYLVGEVKFNNNASDPTGVDNDVLVAMLGENGYPRNGFGTTGFK